MMDHSWKLARGNAAGEPASSGAWLESSRHLSPDLAAFLRWFINEATSTVVGEAELFEMFCVDLHKAGLPLWRAALQLENLHPLYYGYCLHWYDGETTTEVSRSHEFAASHEFIASPYLAALNSTRAYRCKLELVEPDLPLLSELKSRGGTDFLSDVVRSQAKMPPGVSWTTRRRGGFSSDDIMILETLTPYLGLVFGTLAERRKVSAVLRTYLGDGPGQEVAEGHIRRGDVRRIEAVVLLTDMRGFTKRTATATETELLDALNSYFECVVNAVSNQGGEILKFIGDGVLACFPVSLNLEWPRRCRDAVQAVRQAREALDAVNLARLADGRDFLEFVAVLNAGSLSYGNIGASNRLDFTVVGPAVNVTSRVERLAKRLDEETVLTSAVAEHLEVGTTRSLGRHRLQNLAGAIELFSLNSS